MTQFSLRQATASDRERLYAIQREGMRPYVEQTWGWDEDFQRDRFRQGFDPEATQVVLSGGREVGFLKVTEREGVITLVQVYIASDHRRRGIGTALLRALLARGLPVKLRVLKANADARRLYKRLGFRVVDESEAHYHMLFEPGCRSPHRAHTSASHPRT